MTGLALFDLDNTLVDRVAAFSRWAESFCHQNNLPTGSVDRLVELDRDGFQPRGELFAQVREEFALADSVENLLASYRVEYPMSFGPRPCGSRLPRPSARSRMEAGRGHQRTGQPGAQTAAGWADRGSGLLVISEVHGAAKPARSIFEAAARMAGCDLAGWMVGDTAEADIAGGRGAGLATIWLSRGRTWAATEFAPDHVCESVPGAVGMILGEDG